MTRGYVCIITGKKVVNVAYLNSDAYLSWYGLQILKAIDKATVDKGINAWVENQRNENIACYGNDDDCKNFALNWIKPDKVSRAIADWTYVEYGYIYDASNYNLKVYHRGKLIVTIDTDNLDEINKYLYLFEKEDEIYKAISYDEDMLADVVNFDKVIKIAAKKDLSELKGLVSKDETTEKIYLSNYHCIATGHRTGHEVYQKEVEWLFGSNSERLNFIVEHDTTEYSDYGWRVLIQTPFVRIPIRVNGKNRFSSEKNLMKSLRNFVKDNSTKLFRLAYLMNYYERRKIELDIPDFISMLEPFWEEGHWFVSDGYLTKEWFKREASRYVA